MRHTTRSTPEPPRSVRPGGFFVCSPIYATRLRFAASLLTRPGYASLSSAPAPFPDVGTFPGKDIHPSPAPAISHVDACGHALNRVRIVWLIVILGDVCSGGEWAHRGPEPLLHGSGLCLIPRRRAVGGASRRAPGARSDGRERHADKRLSR
jgi:hypothetical protein